MPAESAIPPVEPSELLYRRIPVKTLYVTEGQPRSVSLLAFMPMPYDVDGISLAREKFSQPENIGTKPGQQYYVAILRACDCIATGLTLMTDDECPPSDGSPKSQDHLQIRELCAANRDKTETEDFAAQLQGKVVDVLGPFTVPAAASG